MLGATAELSASVARVLAPLEISIPVVLMNGAQGFDLKTGHYLHTEYLPRPVVTEIAGILQARGITGFMYGLENDTMSTYYESLGFGRLVGFGDNLNDLSLFEVCDEAYAVSNAQSELSDLATAQIGSNIEDGVARWLDARFKET